MIAICIRFFFFFLGEGIGGSCENYGFFLAWDSPFGAVGEGGGGGAYGLCPKLKARRAAHLAFRNLSCWEASVTPYLWF